MPRHPASPTLVIAVLIAALLGACSQEDIVSPTSTTGTAPEPGEPPPDDGAGAEGRIERTVFDLVNAERRERGLEALAWDDSLASLARDWSARMAERGVLEHQDAQRMQERAEGFTAVGENIFTASGPVPASTIHVGWMRSDGHRANVLRPAFDRLGVGVVCTDDGEVWATQRFGRSTGSGFDRPSDEIPPREPIVASRGDGPSCPGGPVEGEVRLESH